MIETISHFIDSIILWISSFMMLSSLCLLIILYLFCAVSVVMVMLDDPEHHGD
ncbi:Uncharacterised protein [Budvicia aquatica]|uniref:Uncharacterized protein n=1 Tax=Budvicia aquatica TaxID=82979 RepID=A0A484ZN62_9GAMM|nr:Uncharacterised protein [Budvicia aquatica]